MFQWVSKTSEEIEKNEFCKTYWLSAILIWISFIFSSKWKNLLMRVEFCYTRKRKIDLIFVFKNCYFLTNVEYFTTHLLILISYNEIRYHLKKFEKTSRWSINAQKLFNFRHTCLSEVIERVFKIFKWRFQIYDRLRNEYLILI